MRFDKLKNVVRFSGPFEPLIRGKTYRERLSNYECSNFINWRGKIVNVIVNFSTSKEKLISNTPMSTTLMKRNNHMLLDGFAIILNIDKNENTISLKPLILGQNIKL